LLFYYITDRIQFSGDKRTRRLKLIDKVNEAAQAGVDFIQLREKDLPTRELELVACDALHAILNTKTRLLLNSRSDIALACQAHGVHLRAHDISVKDARLITKRIPEWLVFVSCHSAAEVQRAAGADMAIFAPVFEKGGSQPAGLESLRAACQLGIPVLALGGITIANAQSCARAGAAGIAGIRLFQENNVAEVLRSLSLAEHSDH
jgi:thiamine-phosphate pyrophosphorylase